MGDCVTAARADLRRVGRLRGDPEAILRVGQLCPDDGTTAVLDDAVQTAGQGRVLEVQPLKDEGGGSTSRFKTRHPPRS